ncbi:MAG: DUF3376 domain-containing protein [Aeromicrobium sp.]
MKETRIAVVMNGGISLAVWMGGVTHELNRLRLASLGEEPVGQAEKKVHDAWRAILDHADAKVIVDTIAGTSAGGLNGTLLATAIARGSDLDGLREVWLDRASLESQKLLREDPKDAPTLLDGSYFTDEINDALASTSRTDAATPVHTPQDVTLMVTATAVGSSLAPMTLEGARHDSYRDSRRIFGFRRQTGHEGTELVNDFCVPKPVSRDGVPSGPLARAARASASFPAAFAPVMEDEDLAEHRVPGSPTVDLFPLMDGGVLDNAPFGPVVEALRRRPVDAPFDRILLYVVPSARGRARTSLASNELPDVSRVLQALISTVREPDQRLDVEMLDAAFQQMAFQSTTTHAVLADLLTGDTVARARMASAARALFDIYRDGRAEAVYRWLIGLGHDVDLTRPGVVDVDPDRVPVVPGARDIESQEPLTGGTPWQWGSSTADRVLRWLGRALVRMADSRDPGGAGANAALLSTAFASLGAAQRRVAEVMDEVERDVERRVKNIVQFDERLRIFSDVVSGYDDEDPIGTAVTEASDDIAAWLSATGGQVTGGSVIDAALQIEVISSVFSWGGDEGDVPAFTYLQASPAAPPLVKVPQVTKLPDSWGYDDQLQEWASKKLYGERWGHFGAFATLVGRKHDWLWGRLDGASTLADMVLGPDGAPQLTAQLTDAILEAENSNRDDVFTAAGTVNELDHRGLYDAMVKEEGGEKKRELLLRTVPEVLGEAKALPAGAEEIARVLAAAGEAVADVVEARNSAKTWLRRLLRRLWGNRGD